MTQNFRQRLLAGIIVPKTESTLDLGQFLQNLLLFETFVLKSGRLREFPGLIEAFGFDAVLELLKNGPLEMRCYAMGFGFYNRGGNDALPLLSYEFARIRTTDTPEVDFDKALEFVAEWGLKEAQAKEMATQLKQRWVGLPETTGLDALEKTLSDFRQNTLAIRTAAAKHIQHEHSRDISPSQVELTISEFGERAGKLLRAETNLTKDHGFEEAEAHAIVQAALSAVSRINQDFSEMREHNAVVGIASRDQALFDANLEFLWSAQNPTRQFSQASRVLEIAGLPDLSEAVKKGGVDLTKLLEIRETTQCKQFREFAWSAMELSDEEIKELVGSLRAKISAKVNSKAGKLVRFLTTSGLGALADLVVPIAGGATVGALDTFVVEKLFPDKGVLTFLGEQYPSVFKD